MQITFHMIAGVFAKTTGISISIDHGTSTSVLVVVVPYPPGPRSPLGMEAAMKLLCRTPGSHATITRKLLRGRASTEGRPPQNR